MLNHVMEKQKYSKIKDYNGKLITGSIEKANALDPYYVSLFSYESNNPQIQSKDSGEPSTISINIKRKRLSAIGRMKSVGPDGIPGEILKLGGEAMIPYLTRLLGIAMNNNAIPGNWIKAIMVPIYKRGDRSVFGKYIPISLTSVICKQMEHATSGYLRQI